MPMPDFRLDGRTVLVTGASSGLGRHFARTLASAGAAVAVAARRADRLDTLVADIVGDGGTALGMSLDVTDAASVAAAFDAIGAWRGPADVIVNNAGVAVSHAGRFVTGGVIAADGGHLVSSL